MKIRTAPSFEDCCRSGRTERTDRKIQARGLRREKWPGEERRNRLVRGGSKEESRAQIKEEGKTGLNKEKGGKKKDNLRHFINA